jgi:hypothetical protein
MPTHLHALAERTILFSPRFFNGPAYLTWSRGQSMQSVGSSALPEGGEAGLPRSWMRAQWELQVRKTPSWPGRRANSSLFF